LSETRPLCLGGAQTCKDLPLVILGDGVMPALTLLNGGSRV
jgi:hypothetical protein